MKLDTNVFATRAHQLMTACWEKMQFVTYNERESVNSKSIFWDVTTSTCSMHASVRIFFVEVIAPLT